MGVAEKHINKIETEKLIIQELDTLQPYIQSHGGKIKFVKLEDSVVYVRLYGTCVECPLSFYTLTYGLERQLKAKVPSVSRVETIDDD